jgi:hypothetical protein
VKFALAKCQAKQFVHYALSDMDPSAAVFAQNGLEGDWNFPLWGKSPPIAAID